jgi:hypothetical protein
MSFGVWIDKIFGQTDRQIFLLPFAAVFTPLWCSSPAMLLFAVPLLTRPTPRSHVQMQAHGPTALWQVGSKGRDAALYELRVGQDMTLGRFDTRKQSPYVSRAQCQIACAADGTAHLYSCGKPVTGYRRRDGNKWSWNWLSNGEAQELAHGAQVSLDSRDSEGAVFTVGGPYKDLQQYGAQQQGQQQGQQQVLWYVQAASDYVDPEAGRLSFRAGDVIEVVQQGEPAGWWEGSLNGQVGWFPSNFCSEPYYY